MSTWFKSRISFFILCFLFSYLIAHGAIRFTNVTNKFGVKGYSYFVGHGVRWIDAIAPGQKIQVTYILAPLNFSETREENKALIHRESGNFLNWKANSENENIKYKIYMFSEEGRRTLLDKVYADTLNYLARGLEDDKSYRFASAGIVHLDAGGEVVYKTMD